MSEQSLQQRVMSCLAAAVNTRTLDYSLAYDLVREMLNEKWNEPPVPHEASPLIYLQRLRDDIRRLDKGRYDDRMVWTVFAAKRLLAEIDTRHVDETTVFRREPGTETPGHQPGCYYGQYMPCVCGLIAQKSDALT